jgi:hypothetical protein
MRQGVLVTALLFLIGIPTVIYTDGWQGLALPQIHWTGIQWSSLRSPALHALGAWVRTPTVNPETAARSDATPATNAQQSVGDALAAARVFARGAGEMRAHMEGGANSMGGVASKPAALAAKDEPTVADGARGIEASLRAANVAAANAAVVNNYGAAVKWYALAEDPEDAEARYAMALDFLNAKPEPDYASAAYWMLTAAERGSARARAALGDMYAAGTGVARNDATAYLWYTLAAQGLRAEEDRVAVAEKSDRLADTMTPQELAEADQLIRERAIETAALSDVTGSIITIGAPASATSQ